MFVVVVVVFVVVVAVVENIFNFFISVSIWFFISFLIFYFEHSWKWKSN